MKRLPTIDITGNQIAVGRVPGMVIGRKLGPSFVGPLDSYTTNLAGAWSVARRLLSSYTGSLIRIRRSSDSAEQDIGADALGNLDVAAITSFVGANSAYVTTVYHQNGGSNLVQTTAANQPRIVNAGTLDVIGGVPAMLFDGSNDYLTCSAQNLDRFSYYVACQTGTSPTINGTLFSQPSMASWSGDYARAIVRGNTGAGQWHGWIESLSYTQYFGAYGAGDVSRLIELHNTTDCGGVQDGVEAATVSAPATITDSIEGFLVGLSHLANSGNFEQYAGLIGELISWNTALNTSSRLARRTVVNDYWNLY